MPLCCQQDDRRDTVRRMNGWNGLDYVEVSDDQLTLNAYFLGKLPPELNTNQPGIEHFLAVEGGQRVKGIKILDIDPVVDPDPEKDDFLIVRLDKAGDFSTYTLRLVGVENIDPRYESVEFSFKINCGSDLDCAPTHACPPPEFDDPDLNYLAKDYSSFRQLILDRFALLLPEWTERHAADLGIALIETLAYTGDYLSYYQDAVATEAYLDTARQRISVRRHARLVDYFLHEGCNARALLIVETAEDVTLPAAAVSFITGLNNALAAQQSILTWDDLQDVPATAYEVFEPVDRVSDVHLTTARTEMHFHTWGERECCIEKGSTSATLVGALDVKVGDILIFEEVLSPTTGLPADADLTHRHAVRLTSVTPGEDPVIKDAEGQATKYVAIEWAEEDALPFPLCISAIGMAPQCAYIDNITVARGNIILVDHGRTVPPEDLGQVPTLRTEAHCECVNEPGDTRAVAGRFRPHLGKVPLTFSQPVVAETPASTLLAQDPRSSRPQVWLSSNPPEPWAAHYDLIASRSEDRHFVVEIDNDGVAHLRFGDGELGFQPPAASTFTATYRIGNGAAGNVGAESISRLVLKNYKLDGASMTIRNPLPAQGGLNAEPVAEAKLYAPHVFRKRIERAIIPEDYEEIAERNPKIQQASAELVWTGSWYEADVAVDPLGSENADPALLQKLFVCLDRYRRMGHDLHLEAAKYVPIDLQLDVCALPHYQASHVRAALLAVFSSRRGGFFHPDNLTFGEGIYLSKIVAMAQAVPGVECAHVTRLQRLYAPPNQEIENGVLPLLNSEIAQLDNDPNYPERGKLEIIVRGGR